MHKKDIENFLEGWKPGHQLNLYLDNGFNTICTRRDQVRRIESDRIEGVDMIGRPFLLPMEHVTLLTFSKEGQAKKGR